MVVGHAAAQVALAEDRHEREQASGEECAPVGVPVLLDVPEAPARDHQDDQGHGDPEPEVHGADAERVPPQLGLRLAPGEQPGHAGKQGADDRGGHDPRLGARERISAEARAPEEQHDHVDRDGDHRKVRGGAVELGEVRHAPAR
jgi:hypothetical protein